MKKRNKKILLIILIMFCLINVFGFSSVKGATSITLKSLETEIENSNYTERHTAIIGSEPVPELISGLKDYATTETFKCDDNHFYVLANLLIQNKPVDDKFKVGSKINCSNIIRNGFSTADNYYILGAKRSR